ncbi:MAG: hypothetical protein AMXMBFR58_38900 [Phycisphaerae bacterium]|jgi:hypothetical protein
MTDDEAKGIDWWNALTESERGGWLRIAGSAVPADAWEAYKRRGRDTGGMGPEGPMQAPERAVGEP